MRKKRCISERMTNIAIQPHGPGQQKEQFNHNLLDYQKYTKPIFRKADMKVHLGVSASTDRGHPTSGRPRGWLATHFTIFFPCAEPFLHGHNKTARCFSCTHNTVRHNTTQHNVTPSEITSWISMRVMCVNSWTYCKKSPKTKLESWNIQNHTYRSARLWLG